MEEGEQLVTVLYPGPYPEAFVPTIAQVLLYLT